MAAVPAECAIPCWSFASCGDVLPRVSVSVDEHTPVGEVIFQATADDPDGVGIWFFTVVQYLKPLPEWTCLSLTLDGELEVIDSATLDYESLTDGTPASAPHAIIEIDAWDYDFETTYDQQDALIEITILDIPESPIFTSLPTGITLTESQQVEQEVFQVNFTDPDVYLGETYSFTMTTNPSLAPFSINTTDGKVFVTRNPCFDVDVTPVYLLHISLFDGTFVISEDLTVTITDTLNGAPVLDNLPHTANVSEDSLNGSVIFTVLTSDPNPCDVITYTLVTTGVPFALNTFSGELVVTDTIDYDTAALYTLTITANDGTVTSDPKTLLVEVLHIVKPPQLTVLPANVSVNENSTGNQTVFYLSFSGNTVSHVMTVSPSGPFSLNVLNTTAAEILLDSELPLNYEDVSMYDITVTVSDGLLNTSENVSVIVLDVGERPTFRNLPNTTAVEEGLMYSNSQLLFAVDYMDQDTGDGVTVTLVTSLPYSDVFNCSTEGQVSLKSPASFDYESVPEYNLTIQITDSSGLYEVALLKITVTDVNEKPVLHNLPLDVYISENSQGDVNLTSVIASDPEGNALSYNITSISPAAEALINISSAGVVGMMRYPNLNYDLINTYTLTVEVSDGTLSFSGVITLYIIDENNPPVLVNVTAVSVLENETHSQILYNIQFVDKDINDNWTFAIEETEPTTAVFMYDPLKGQISFIDDPAFDYEEIKKYKLNISVTDSTGLTDYQILEVDVLNIDEEPLLIVTPNVTTVNETEITNRTLFSVSYLDPENTTIIPSMLVTPTWPFLLRNMDRSVSEIVLDATTKLNFENVSSYDISVSITDGRHYVSVTVRVIVLDVEEPPSFSNLPNVTSVQEGSRSVPSTGHIFTVEYTDEDTNDNVTVTLINVDPSSSAFLCGSQGDITVPANTNLDYESESSYNLTIQLEDSHGLSVSSILTVVIVNVDEKPVILNLPSYGNISEDVSGDYVNITTILAFDPEGQPLIYNITQISPEAAAPLEITSSGLLKTLSDAQFNYDIVNIYNLTIEVGDGLLSTSSYFLLYIGNEDRAPAFLNATESIFVTENETISRAIHRTQFYDKDINDNWTFVVEGVEPSTSVFLLDNFTGNLSFVDNPGFDFERVDNFTLNISVTDSTGLKDYQVVTIYIENINEAPNITNLPTSAVVIDEDDSGNQLAFHILCEDQEQDALDLTLDVNPSGPFVISELGEIRIPSNPALNFENISRYVLSVSCTDSQNLSDLGTLEVLVGDINEAPVFDTFADVLNILENTTGRTFLLNLTAFDEDTSDSLLYNITSTTPAQESSLFSVNAETGELWLESNGSIDYEREQKYTVAVQVIDMAGLWDVINITIDIVDVNERPTIQNLPNNMTIYDGVMKNKYIFGVSATDPDGDSLVYFIDLSYPANAPFVINNTGNIFVINNTVLDHFTVPMYTLYITVSDGALSSTTKYLTVHVLNTPDPPTFINLEEHIYTGELTLGNISSFQFTDPDGDNVSVTMNVIGQTYDSPFVLSASDVITVEPPGLDFESTTFYSLNVTLTDQTGLTTTKALNISVLDENEHPSCTINSTDVDLQEELPIGTLVDAGIYCIDVDTMDSLSYNLSEQGLLYFDLISLNEKDVAISSRIDRDLPSNINRITLALTVTDQGGLQDSVTINFNINDINDNVPVFDTMTLNVSVEQTTQNGTMVAQVRANDLDAGVNGTVLFSEISNSQYLSIDSTGNIYLISQLNYAEQSIIEYEIETIDGGTPQLSSRATFTLYVEEVTTPMFDKEFYNLEVFHDATMGLHVGNVKAQNGDGKNILYTFDVDHKEFTIEPKDGEISVQSELQDDKTYVLYISAVDVQVLSKYANAIVRIDTYEQSTYLIDFEFENAISNFDQSYVLKFKTLIRQLIPDCLPRVIFINNVHWSEYAYFNVSFTRRQLLQKFEPTTLTLLILKNNDTESLHKLDSEKQFYTVTTLMQYLTSDGEGSPNEYFNSETFSEYPVKSITPHIATSKEPEVNWWTESTEGLATTAALGFLGALLLILLIIGICVFCKRKRDQKKKRIFEPSKVDKTKSSRVLDDNLMVEDIQDTYTRSPYTKMTRKPTQATWEALPAKEIICKSPNVGESVNENIDGYPIFSKTPSCATISGRHTTLHSLSESIPDVSDRGSPDAGYNSFRTVTPISESRSMVDFEVLSLQGVRASIMSPIFTQRGLGGENSSHKWEEL